MLTSVRNRKGSVLLQILVATAVMSTSFYFLTNYLIEQRKGVSKTANLVNLRFAMNSALDYIIFGVRQKYCFTDDNLLLEESPERCNLSHKGSVERLIMSEEQENFIRQLISSGTNVGRVDLKNIRLREIKSYIQGSAITKTHPLFPIFLQLKRTEGVAKVDGISVTMRRDDSPYLPRAGREVYLRLTVALKESRTSKDPIKVGSTKLTTSSSVVIYPRELGSFAFVLPNELRLDRAWNASLDKGSSSIHMFEGRKELRGSQGLVFQSPVFVNSNIHLPVDAAPETAIADRINYSPVTFADRVYIGNGWVYSNGKPYRPQSMGGIKHRHWTDVRTFGGFLKGLENDGGVDLGLQYFAKMIAAAPPNTDLMAKCIERANSQASTAVLYRTKLSGSLNSEASNEFRYRLSLSDGNSFEGQENPNSIKEYNWGTGKSSLHTSYASGVVKVRFALGTRAVEAQMSRSGKLEMTLQVGSTAYYDSLTAAASNAKNLYLNELAKYENYENQLKDYRRELKKVKRQLAAELEKPKESDKKPASEGSNVATTEISSGESDAESDFGSGGKSSHSYYNPVLTSSLEKKIAELEKALENLTSSALPDQDLVVGEAQKKWDLAKEDQASYEFLVSNPPRVVIETEPVYSFWGLCRDRLNLKVKFTNVKSMIDETEQYRDPVLAVQAYDGTYYNSSPVDSKKVNKGLLRFLNFRITADKQSILPPDSMSESSSSHLAVADSSDETDYARLDEDCEKARNAKPSQSFGGAGWDVSFAPTTRTSWNFAGGSKPGVDPGLAVFEWDNINRSNAKFEVRSIVGKCVVKASSTFITGFFACDELEIQARSTPLRIIGTFIVGRMRIDPSALKAGITWSAIYHPQATRELRSVGPAGVKVLSSFSGRDCNLESVDPIWHPIPSVQEVADRRSCNTISLRAKADPFQWTAVDPDCGMTSGSSNTTCKRRLVRFFVVEQSREVGL